MMQLHMYHQVIAAFVEQAALVNYAGGRECSPVELPPHSHPCSLRAEAAAAATPRSAGSDAAPAGTPPPTLQGCLPPQRCPAAAPQAAGEAAPGQGNGQVLCACALPFSRLPGLVVMAQVRLQPCPHMAERGGETVHRQHTTSPPLAHLHTLLAQPLTKVTPKPKCRIP